MGNQLIYDLHKNPIVAAIHDQKDLETVKGSAVKAVFILNSDVIALKQMIDTLQAAQKHVYVHLDLIKGISSSKEGVKFLKEFYQPDGLITTHSSLVRYAKRLNFFVIQRLFILDSINLKSGIQSIRDNNPDAVEILPGIMDSITKKIAGSINPPLIVGGLISSKKDVIGALNSEAMGISTSKKEIWNM